MPLGMEVGLGPGDFVFHGDPAVPLKKGHGPHPMCGPCLFWPNGWMDEDATWYESRPRPRSHCVRRGPNSPPRERGTAAPSFRPMSILVAVAHLSYCWALVTAVCPYWSVVLSSKTGNLSSSGVLFFTYLLISGLWDANTVLPWGRIVIE